MKKNIAVALLIIFSTYFISAQQSNKLSPSEFDAYQKKRHQEVDEQHRMGRTYFGTGSFDEMFEVVSKLANVSSEHRKDFYAMLYEKYFYNDRNEISEKINRNELNDANVLAYKQGKIKEYASYYAGAFLVGKTSLLGDNAPKVKMVDDKAMEDHISSKLGGGNSPQSAACGNADFETGDFTGWYNGKYQKSQPATNCGSSTPNPMPNNGFNYTVPNTPTTNEHGICTGGTDPNAPALPCLSPFGGGTYSARLGNTTNGCGAAQMTFSFVVTPSNINFTYDYAAVMYDGHVPADAPKVLISMIDLTTGQPIGCASYSIDASQAPNPNSGFVATPTPGAYFKPWSQVVVPLTGNMGHNVAITMITTDCDATGHYGYAYFDFHCSPFFFTYTPPINCVNPNGTITGPAGAAAYSWSTIGSGTIVGATNGQSITVSSSGDYQVVLTAFGNGGCQYTLDTIISIVIPATPIATYSANVVCVGTSTQFTDSSYANGGPPLSSWGWNFGDGGTSSSQNPGHTYASSGTFVATLTVTNSSGCTDTYTTNVTVNPNITPSFVAPPVCVGATTSFSNTTTGAITYSWTFGDGNSSTTASPTNTYSAAGTYVTTLSVTATGGCTGTINQNVVVNPLPLVTATTNSLCSGTAAVTLICNGAVTYTWNTGATTATISDNPSVTTNYTVTGTDANGCVNTATTTISVFPTPTLAVGPTDICAGSTGTLTANGATTYTWTGTSIVLPGGATVTANPPTTSTYTVIGAIGNCLDTMTAIINVNPMPVPAFVSSIECFGTPTSFTNNSTPVGSSYNWAFGDGNTSTTAQPTNTYSAAGSYVTTLTVTAPGVPTNCAVTVTGTVVVKPIPALNPIANVGVCDQFQIVVAPFVSVPGGATVAWTNDNTAIGLGAAGAGNISPFTGTNAGAAPIQGIVTAIPTLNGCVGPPITFTLTVAPLPTIVLVSPPITCPGQNVPSPTYTTNPTDPSMTFGWVNSNILTGQGASGTGIPPAFTAASNGTLANISSVVTVTPTLNGCVGPPANYTVQIYPTPVIDPIANVEFCPNVPSAAINLTLQPAGGTPSFAWFNSNTSIGLASSGTVTPIPSFTSVNTGSVVQVANLSVSGSLNGCPAIPVPFTITVDPYPIAAFNANHLICVGSPMTFTDASTIGTGSVVQWAWNLDGTASPFSTLQNPQLVIQPAGTHSVTLLVTSDKGCTNAITHPVYINYIPVANYNGGGQGCPILTVNNFVDASSVTGPAQVVTWNWDFGNTATSTTQSPGFVTYGNPSHVQNAVYVVSLIVSTDSGCVSTAYSSPCITVYPHPLADFTYGPQDPAADVMNPIVYFSDMSQGANGQNGLQWYLGDVFLNNLANNYTTVQNPVHAYESYDPYTYYVTQWVQNTYGCKDSITKPIEILPNWTFYIPNAFSPNGDGVNEGWKGTGIGIDNTTYNLWVFDRWGNMIFYSSDMEQNWDGRIQGKNGDIVQEDVYVWKVKFHDFTGRKHEYKGTVSVIK